MMAEKAIHSFYEASSSQEKMQNKSKKTQ